MFPLVQADGLARQSGVASGGERIAGTVIVSPRSRAVLLYVELTRRGITAFSRKTFRPRAISLSIIGVNVLAMTAVSPWRKKVDGDTHDPRGRQPLPLGDRGGVVLWWCVLLLLLFSLRRSQHLPPRLR